MSSIITTLFNKKDGENRLVRLDMGSLLVKGFPIEVEIVTDEDSNLENRKFDGDYIDINVQVNDYREFLDEMDKSLERAEELMEVLGAGGEYD